MSGVIYFIYLGESNIRHPEAKSKGDTEAPNKSRSIQNMSRNDVLTVSYPFFFNWLGVYISMFSSRNVLEAQWVFCLFRVRPKTNGTQKTATLP